MVLVVLEKEAGKDCLKFTAVASLVSERRLRAWASVVSAPGLNCSMTHGISLDQG